MASAVKDCASSHVVGDRPLHPQILRTLSSARTRLRAELESIECNGAIRTAEREEVLHRRLAVIEEKLKQQAEPVRH